MNKDDTLHAIMLSELPQVGEKAAQRILTTNRERHHSLATFFRLPAAVLRESYELHAAAIERLTVEREEHDTRCRWLADNLERVGGEALLIASPAYPSRVRQRVEPPPAVLFRVGEPSILASPTLAVLNSRSIDERAVYASHAAVQAAIEQRFTVVTGGMKASHRISAVAARSAAAPRAIVLDRGLFATFGGRVDRDPFGFGPGRGPLDSQRTLVVSPFRLMDHAAAHNGKRRDELIAALADVIIAVHARPGGVIEHVCLQALDRGQVVLSWYGENAGLIAAGATPIEESDLAGELTRYLSRE